jgi:hypothetical protein
MDPRFCLGFPARRTEGGASPIPPVDDLIMIKQTIPLNRVGHGGYGAYALVPPKPLLLQYCARLRAAPRRHAETAQRYDLFGRPGVGLAAKMGLTVDGLALGY